MTARFLSLALLVALVLVPACDELSWKTLVVTAQVAKTLDPESNTASILVGEATVENILHDDWMETPDPGDTTYWDDPFPAKLTPVRDADVRLNGDPVGEKVPGVYFAASLDLEHGRRYDLGIELADGRKVTAAGVLPGRFGVLAPEPGGVLDAKSVRATWTRSDSAERYVVGVTPADSASPAQGWVDATADTTLMVPAAAFRDSLGNPAPGDFVFSVSAVSGGWNKSGLDLFLAGGNVAGAAGVFGCAVHPAPVLFRVEER